MHKLPITPHVLPLLQAVNYSTRLNTVKSDDRLTKTYLITASRGLEVMHRLSISRPLQDNCLGCAEGLRKDLRIKRLLEMTRVFRTETCEGLDKLPEGEFKYSLITTEGLLEGVAALENIRHFIFHSRFS
ncbi:hypothetical protein J6590_016794 [Homalodisca vitripennis]|nr:hypothetical protein J6590_016794 [Homalodisca vitripennis]